MQTVILDKSRHDRGRFDCGIEALNNYLKVMAGQQAKRENARKKLLHASDTLGFPLVIVDAKEGAKAFYERYGFTGFRDTENKLFISIVDIRESQRS